MHRHSRYFQDLLYVIHSWNPKNFYQRCQLLQGGVNVFEGIWINGVSCRVIVFICSSRRAHGKQMVVIQYRMVPDACTILKMSSEEAQTMVALATWNLWVILRLLWPEFHAGVFPCVERFVYLTEDFWNNSKS